MKLQLLKILCLLSVFIFQNIRNSNILQNNIVQTIASAGESIAAVAVFTITSVVMLGYWDRFHYLETMLLIWISGTLGVLFSMPLRHMMIIQNKIIRVADPDL